MTRKATSPNVVFTAGYQGQAIGDFLAKLKKANIELVLDVRYNPVSRVRGFSKSSLSDSCQTSGMTYKHFRNLGIPSALRKSLATPEDYRRLFDKYERELLPQAEGELRQAEQLVREHLTVLICFEKDAGCCHRTRLARSISAMNGFRVIDL